VIAAPGWQRRVAASVAVVGAAALLPGCLVLPCFTSVRTGALLPRERVEALKPGATTAAQVLEWLGPPLAIARGRVGVVQVPDVGFRRSGANAVSAASFFEKFSAGAAAPGDVVYFYRAHEVATPGSGAVVIVGDQGTLVGHSRDEERDERLWILLDGASGVVKACVHERDEPPPAEEPPAPRPGEDTA
jgi:hypothetical protein